MEKVIVCISNPNHAEKLIQRGKVLANAFNGQCMVLNILKVPFDELDFNQLQTKLMFESLAAKYQVEMITEPSKYKKISHHIAEFTEKNYATQIVLGHAVQSKFELVLQESFINNLFEKLEGVDIHLVEVTREINDEVEFHRGISAVLIHKDGEYELSLSENQNQAGKRGVFYQSNATDFSNGFFVIKKENEHQVVKVERGKVKNNDFNQA
jgi:two-component system, OmpR family, sensor histidine kinase KdpD